MEESNSTLREENLKLKRLLEEKKDRDVLKDPLKDYFYHPCEKRSYHGASSSTSSSTKNQENNQVSEEVQSISFSIPSDNDVHDASFTDFENHTKGIGMKLLTKMGYDGRGLGVNGQGIINPIEVKRQTHKAGLGYKEIREIPNMQRQESRIMVVMVMECSRHEEMSTSREELNLVLLIKVRNHLYIYI